QLHHDEVSGIGNLYSELYVPQGNGAWHYLSFPSGTPYTAIHDGVSRFNITDPDESPLFEWDAAVGDWVLPKGGASGSFEGGKGYIVYMGQNATGTYTTTLPATLTLALPLTSPQNQQLALDYTASPNFMNINGTHIEGWNFIGNPFPSAYDLFQSAISPNVLASAVRRNATNTGFETYVFTEPHVASRYIAPNQAIWVRSLSAANADFEWQLSKRSPQETPIRTKNDEITSFFLEVVGPQGVPDETRIYFRDAATNGFDREYDGDKLPNDKGYPNLYTVTENLPYAVNSLPYFDELTVLPLAFTCDCNGLFRLRLKEKIGQYNIYLKEKNSSKLLDLTNEEFRFFSNGGDEEQVFELVFSNQPRVALDWKNYTAWFAQNSLFIRPVTATNQLRYRLTDIQGRYMANGSINESQSVFEIPLTYVASGVYVLYVTSEEGGTEVIKMVKH
ncbi:MAG: T9SS type A sorting domain-containing protein, partial [Schleiferiaceae bacterium]|nr:T9SS type A sorting domain-containing protein [Schleiferiaceae bacterium]